MTDVEYICGENYSLQMEKKKIEQAISQGMEIVKGDNNTLLFDLDGEEELRVFKERVEILYRKGFVPHVVISRSKSGNYHAVITISTTLEQLMIEPIRIAIQACLGSDWKREFLGVLRYLNNQREVSMLFRPQHLEIAEVIDFVNINEEIIF